MPSKPDANFIWSIANLLRGPYKPKEYGDVVLPMTILRRLDCVLAATKDAVLAEQKRSGTDRHFQPCRFSRFQPVNKCPIMLQRPCPESTWHKHHVITIKGCSHNIHIHLHPKPSIVDDVLGHGTNVPFQLVHDLHGL